MKAAKILSGLLAFILLIVPVASAVDVAPVLSLTGNYDRTTTTAVLTAVAVDILDNAGVAWIKMYEDGNLIAEKQCNFQSSCTLVKAVVKTAPGGTFTYTAEAFDKGGHRVTSQGVNITFAGVDEVPPEYSNIIALPASPAPYGAHQFSAVWTDNGRIGHVWIEHNFFGANFRTEVNGNGNVYTYNLDDIRSDVDLGAYHWRMIADDVAEQGPNTNETPWQDYTIVRATPTIDWTIQPSSTVVFPAQTSVECEVGENTNTETQLVLYREGVEVSNPDVQTLSPGDYEYECRGAETEHYNAVSENSTLTVDKTASQVNLLLNTIDGDITAERLFGNVDMAGTSVSGDTFLVLYIDGQEAANGTSPVLDSETFNETGMYNITVVSPGNENFSSASETHFVNVTDTRAPDSVTGLSALNIGAGSVTIEWTNPSNDDFEGVIVLVDSVNVANVTGIEPSNVSNYTIGGLNYSTAYTITLHTFDSYGNINSTDVSITPTTLPDTEAPQLSNVSGPSNSTYAANASYSFEAQASDNVAVALVQLDINSVVYNLTLSNGTYAVDLMDLAAGEYNWTITAFDTSGSSNSTGIASFTVARAASECSLSLDKASPIPFNENITVSGSCTNPESAAVLLRNGADVTSAELNQTIYLSAGMWNYTLSVAETQNYTAASAEEMLNVTKLVSGVNLTLNNSTENLTVFVNENVDVEGTLVSGEAGIDLLVGAASVASGASPLNYVASFASPGVYNISVVYNESENYTASQEQLTLTVIPIIRNVSISSSPASGYAPFDQNITYTITVTNTGNIEDNFTVSLTNTDSIDTAALNQTAITALAPSASVQLQMTAGDNDTGVYNVTLDVASDTDASSNASAVVTTRVVDYSEVINSWVDSVYYLAGNYTAMQIPELIASRLVDSTVSDNLTSIQVSEVQRSTIANSTITSSAVNDSTVSGSNLDTCTVLNSTVIETTSSGCWIEDSYVDPSDTTGSTITGASSVISSNVINSTVFDSSIVYSDVYRSTVNSSTVSANSVVNDSTVTDSVVRHSVLVNAVVELGSLVEESTVTDSTIRNSTIWNSTITLGSVITDSNVRGSTVTNSTITNSTIPEGTTVVNATIINGVIVNGTVNGNNYTNTNLTDAVNYAPVAGISASATSVVAGGSITFTSTSTDANIPGLLNDSLSYAWTVNGVPAGTANNFTQVFSAQGAYEIGLTVTDSFAMSDSASMNVTATRASGGGGGGSSSHRESGPRIIFINLTRGSFVTMDLFQGDIVEFNFEGEKHRITIKDVTLANTTVVVASDPVQLVIAKYDTKNVNLDADQYNDLSIKVEEIIGNDQAKFTFGLKELPEYEPIVIPEPQETAQPEEATEPEAIAEPEVQPEANETSEPEAEGMSLWQKIVAWFRGGEDSEATGAAVAETEEQPEGAPRAVLGWTLAFLVVALGISAYFLVRKKLLEKRIERYLM